MKGVDKRMFIKYSELLEQVQNNESGGLSKITLFEMHKLQAKKIHDDPHYGSESHPLFRYPLEYENLQNEEAVDRYLREKNNESEDIQVFDPHNWCSGMDILRAYMYHLIDTDRIRPDGSSEMLFTMSALVDGFSDKEIECGMVSEYIREEDQHTIYLSIYTSSDFLTMNLITRYMISWYKNRGCTERILRNEDLITIDEYCALCTMFILHLKDQPEILHII